MTKLMTTRSAPAWSRRRQRMVHLVVAVPLLAYVYATPDAGSALTWGVRWVLAPALIVSGVVMWQAPRLRRWRKRRVAA